MRSIGDLRAPVSEACGYKGNREPTILPVRAVVAIVDGPRRRGGAGGPESEWICTLNADGFSNQGELRSILQQCEGVMVAMGGEDPQIGAALVNWRVVGLYESFSSAGL